HRVVLHSNVCHCLSHAPTSPQIKESEDEDPHEIDEVPVQAHDFDDLVVASSAREKAASLYVKIAAPDLSRDDDQEDHTDGHVRTVEARDHEEARAELRRAPRIFPGPHALHDQLRPLEGLHADERCAERGGSEHQDRGFAAITAIAEVD